jgi:hypothetical protein
MDAGIAVEVIEVGEDLGLEFCLGCDTDVTEHGALHLGEEAFDEVEPRTVLPREHEGEAALRLGRNPGGRLLGDVRRVTVEDQLDGGVCWIGLIEPLEQATELARATALLDAGMYMAVSRSIPASRLSVPWRLYS